MILEDAHVRLVPMERAHVPALTIAATRDRTGFDLAPVPGDEGEMTRYVERALADQEAGRSLPFVALAGGQEVVGCYRLMSLEWWSWPERPIRVDGEPRVFGRDPPDVAEIGHVWIATHVRRTKVNTAACLLLMRQAFDVWRVHRLVWKTDARNERSRATFLRFGGTFEGILRSHSPAADGIVRDTAMFSLIASEWPAARARLERMISAPST